MRSQAVQENIKIRTMETARALIITTKFDMLMQRTNVQEAIHFISFTYLILFKIIIMS